MEEIEAILEKNTQDILNEGKRELNTIEETNIDEQKAEKRYAQQTLILSKNRNKEGRPLGSTNEVMTIKRRLKVLKDIALNKKKDDRVRLASIDLYTKLSGDAVRVNEDRDGAVINIEFTNKSEQITKNKVETQKSLVAPPKNKMISSPQVSKEIPVIVVPPSNSPYSGSKVVVDVKSDENYLVFDSVSASSPATTVEEPKVVIDATPEEDLLNFLQE